LNDHQLKAYHANKNRRFNERIHDGRIGTSIDKTDAKPTLPQAEKTWEDMNESERREQNKQVFSRVHEDSNEFIKANMHQYQTADADGYYDRVFGCKHCPKKYRSNYNPYTQHSAQVMGKQVRNLVNHINKKHGINSSYDRFAFQEIKEQKPPQYYRTRPLNNLVYQLSDIRSKDRMKQNKIEDGMRGLTEKQQRRHRLYGR
jgi:hypothetical protein